MDWLEKIRTRHPEFDTLKCQEITQLQIEKTKAQINVSCLVQHYGGWSIHLKFINVTRFRASIPGETIELAEWMCFSKEGRFVIADELKNHLYWECDDIVLV